jgi:hypothetical protein
MILSLVNKYVECVKKGNVNFKVILATKSSENKLKIKLTPHKWSFMDNRYQKGKQSRKP